MADYSDILDKLREFNYMRKDLAVCHDAADAIEALQMELAKLEVHCLYVDAGSKVDTHRIRELEHQLKVECDTYLWKRKLMSRRIASLQYWMKKLFKYGSSPEAKRNQMTMTTEIPDYLMREGEDILLDEISALEKGE
jgi:hypothetical protein